MSGKHEESVKTISLEEVLDELGMTEEEFDAMVEEAERDFREGRTISHEQLKRECGLI